MGNQEDYLIPNRERRTRGSHDFKFIVPKGHKDIFRFSFIFPRTITEWNKLAKETVTSQSLLGYLLLGVNIRFFISFICSFSFYLFIYSF